MGKVVATEFVPLDGVMEDPGGAEGFKHEAGRFDFDTGDEGTRFSSTRRWRPGRCCSAG